MKTLYCQICSCEEMAHVDRRGRCKVPNCGCTAFEVAETWLPVMGYSYYLISTWGRTYRLERTINRIHTGPYVQKSAVMADRQGNDQGHRCITLYDDQGVRHKHWIHRLVAKAFIPNPRGYPYVLHGLKGSAFNHVENIRWGTQSENELDKRRHRLARQEAREL